MIIVIWIPHNTFMLICIDNRFNVINSLNTRNFFWVKWLIETKIELLKLGWVHFDWFWIWISEFTIDNFLPKQALENQTAILNATVCQREKFIELIEAEIKLQLVEIPHWAGLGGVCYIPPEQRRSLDDQGNLLMGIEICLDAAWSVV